MGSLLYIVIKWTHQPSFWHLAFFSFKGMGSRFSKYKWLKRPTSPPVSHPQIANMWAPIVSNVFFFFFFIKQVANMSNNHGQKFKILVLVLIIILYYFLIYLFELKLPGLTYLINKSLLNLKFIQVYNILWSINLSYYINNYLYLWIVQMRISFANWHR